MAVGYDIVLVALGALLGIGSSGAFWWVQSHYFVPRIEFSKEISKKKNPFSKRGWMYRIKFVNHAKRRAIDVNTTARVGIRGLHYNNIYWLSIPTLPTNTPIIGPKGGDRVARLLLSDIPVDRFEYFPGHIKQMAIDGNLTLESLLELGTDAYLRLYVTAYDEFGGAKKMFASKLYRLADIRKGKFANLSVVKDDLIIEGWTDLPTMTADHGQNS